ncbi:MAG: hypothetical protein CR978_01420 [Gammaproteobacteria bacterium]|nr:MAG: hypothetical protein CR978_01420 [Gammaproteobacteria bacterium]
MKPSLIVSTIALASFSQLAQSQMLEEVLVTAEFRDIALLEQPASTTVIDSQMIVQQSAQHLENLLALTPNINYASGSSRARFFQVRGIGERSQFQEPLNPSVGVLIDGIDFSGMGSAGTLFDIAQVEVLRGPQGTLHGANALAGLINIRSADPSEDPMLKISGSAGNYNTRSVGVVSSGPLSNTLGYRLAAQQYLSDGFIKNDYLGKNNTNNRDEKTLRAKLKWQASDNSTVDFSLLHIDVDNGYDAFSLDNTRHTLSDKPGVDKQRSTAGIVKYTGDLKTLSLEADLSLANTKTHYGYDEDWAYPEIHPYSYSSEDNYRRDRDSVSAQVRLLSTADSTLFKDSTDWAAGIYLLSNREALRRQYTYLDSDFYSDYDTDTIALFGQLDTRLTDRLNLISGLRFERRATDYSDVNNLAYSPSKNLWGGRLTLSFDLNDSHLLYGGISRGYRANGINAEVLASLEVASTGAERASLARVTGFNEEFANNFELGLKAQYLDEALTLRLAAFYMDREDMQVKGSFVIPKADGSTAFIDYTNNAANGRNAGLELELTWHLNAVFSAYFNAGYLDTELEDYVNADGVDLSGREQAHAPNYQYALGLRADLGRGFYLRVDVDGKDAFYFSDRHDLKAPAYDLLHLRAGYEADTFSAAIWVRNATDKDYYTRGFGSFGNDPRKDYVTEPYFQFGDPRQFGVSASFTF